MDQEEYDKKEDGTKLGPNPSTRNILFIHTGKKTSNSKIESVINERTVFYSRKRKNSAESQIVATKMTKPRMKHDSEHGSNINNEHIVKTCSVLQFDKVKIHIDCCEQSRHKATQMSKAFHEILEKQFVCQVKPCSFSQFSKERRSFYAQTNEGTATINLDKYPIDVIDHLRNLNITIQEGSTEKEHTLVSFLSGEPPTILFSTSISNSGADILCQHLKIFSTNYSLSVCPSHRLKLGIEFKPKSKCLSGRKKLIGENLVDEIEKKNDEIDLDNYVTNLTSLKDEITLLEENRREKSYKMQEVYEKYIFNIDTALKSFTENIKEREIARKNYEKDIVTYEYMLTNLRGEIENKEKEKENYEKETTKYEIILRNLKEKIKIINEIEREKQEKILEDYEKDFIKCEAKLKSLNEEIGKKEIEWKSFEIDIDKYKTVSAKLKEDIEKKEIEWKNYERDIITYKTILSNVKEEVETKEKEYKSYEKDIVNYEFKLTMLKEEIEKKEIKGKNYEKDILKYETLIPRLKEEIEMKEMKRKNYENDIVTYEFMLRSLKQEIGKKESDVKNYEKNIIKYEADITGLKEELEKKLLEKENYEKDIVAYEAMLASLKEEVEIVNDRIEDSRMVLQPQQSVDVRKDKNVQFVNYIRENDVDLVGIDAKGVTMTPASTSSSNSLGYSLSRVKVMQNLPKPIEEPGYELINPGFVNLKTVSKDSDDQKYTVYKYKGHIFAKREKGIQPTPVDVVNISGKEKQKIIAAMPSQQVSEMMVQLPKDQKRYLHPKTMGEGNAEKGLKPRLTIGDVSGLQIPNSVSLMENSLYLNSNSTEPILQSLFCATCHQKVSSLDLIGNKSYTIQSIQGNPFNITDNVNGVGEQVITEIMPNSVILLPGDSGSKQKPNLSIGDNICLSKRNYSAFGEVTRVQNQNYVSSAEQSLQLDYNGTAPIIQRCLCSICIQGVGNIDFLENKSHDIQSVQASLYNNVAKKSGVDKQIVTEVIPGQDMNNNVITFSGDRGFQQRTDLIEGSNISKSQKAKLTNVAGVSGVQPPNLFSLGEKALHTNAASTEPNLQSFVCATIPQEIGSIGVLDNRSHMVQSTQAIHSINRTKISGSNTHIKTGVMPGQQMTDNVEYLIDGIQKPYLVDECHKTQKASGVVATNGKHFDNFSSSSQPLHLNSDNTVSNSESIVITTSTQKTSSINLPGNRSQSIQSNEANTSKYQLRPRKRIAKGNFTSNECKKIKENIKNPPIKIANLTMSTQSSLQQNTQVGGQQNNIFQGVRAPDITMNKMQVKERIQIYNVNDQARAQQVKSKEYSLFDSNSTTLDITTPVIGTPNIIASTGQPNLQTPMQIKGKQQKSYTQDNNKQYVALKQIVTPLNNFDTTMCICGIPGNWYDYMLECRRCKRWFHEACVGCLNYELICGDINHLYVCQICNNGKEFLHRLPIDWDCIVHLALWNISNLVGIPFIVSTADNCKYFDFKSQITPWIEHHWELLQCPERLQIIPSMARIQHILLALQSNSNKFGCGNLIGMKSSLWKLKVTDPPMALDIILPLEIPFTEALISYVKYCKRRAELPPVPSSFRIINKSLYGGPPIFINQNSRDYDMKTGVETQEQKHVILSYSSTKDSANTNPSIMNYEEKRELPPIPNSLKTCALDYIV